MEALGNAIKVLAEKHLIPSILSLVTSTFIYLKTPSDFWVIEKITGLGYWLLVAGCFFLLVQLLIHIKGRLNTRSYIKSVARDNRKHRMQQNKKALEVLWDYVEELNQEDRDYLKQFLKTKNQPITLRGNVYFASGRLFNSRNVHSQKGTDAQGTYTKYILEDSIYNALVLSAELYGKISRFEEV